jgi:hypothetical protein
MSEIWFARINRRPHQGQTLDETDFAGDMQRLIDAHSLTYTQRDKGEQRVWFAGDLERTPDGRFLTGRLGYSEKREDLKFDVESWSWAKGDREVRDTGSDRTVVAFAVDLSNEGRWVAFMTAPRLKANQFRAALQRCLGEAALAAGVLGADWDVDFVLSPTEIREWMNEHDKVFRLERVVRMSNPGKDLDEIRKQLRDTRAESKTEIFAAPPGKTLDTTSHVVEEAIDEVDQGFSRVTLKARGPNGKGEVSYSTRNRADKVTVDDPGETNEAQQASVLRELAAYVSGRRTKSGKG